MACEGNRKRWSRGNIKRYHTRGQNWHGYQEVTQTNSIIYSSGVGTVVFNPVIDGKACQPVEFTRVLHVPLLQNNLLACLYLTRHKGIEIRIDWKQMDFVRNGKTLFCAPIGSTNCAHFSGSTEPPHESANWVSTLPLTLSLWHRRCCHHNLADITRMHKEGLVTGMTFGSSTKPDIVCEPCLTGKMHSNSFPLSSSRATQPLELVHSDLHGPLPVATREGYPYWMTFIDDATSHRAAMLELPSGDPTDYARCQHQHSTATVPQIPFSFFYSLCLIFIYLCLLSHRLVIRSA